jgi:YD repeat-containing protein
MCSSKIVSSELLGAKPSSFLAALLTIIFLSLTTNAQTITTTTSIADGRTPSALQPGSPAGSYPLSGFDNVNLYNGNLNFRLPLLRVGGRGSAEMTVALALNLKSWHIKHTHKVMPDESELNSYVPTQTGWKPYSDYGAGRLTGRHYGLQTSSNLSCRWYSKTLSRLTFSTSDGTEYELRDQLTNGQPLSSTCTQGAHRGTVFVTADGTAATFVSDAAIYDNPAVNTFGPHGFSVSGFLMLKDGSRYRIDNGNITWIRDRNGNKISFAYSTNSMTITDSLNRIVTVNYDVSDIAPYGLCDQIIYKGFGGAQRILRISHTNLGNALRPNSGYSIRTLGGPTGLFPETNGSSSTNYDPTVTSAVWLPDGRSYKFYYNSYGELARVELPTGGAYEYDMTDGSGIICPNGCGWPDEDRQIYRRVVERRVYPDGGTGSSYEHRDVYTNSEIVGSSTSTVTVEQLAPTGTVLARSRHYFASSALNSLFGGAVAYAYGAWFEGSETQTEALSTTGDISTATVLRRGVTTRAQRASVSWWAPHASTHGLDINKEPPNDPRVTEIVSTLEPSASNLVSKQAFAYDDSVPFNNRNNVKEYGFGNGSPGGLVREIRTTYLTSSTYTDTNVHIRNLPTEVSVHDGGGTKRARSSIEYDNYNPDSYHSDLSPRANISGLESAFTTNYTTRGNATSSTHYLLVNGGVTGSISSYSHYDVAGNVVKLIDARSTPSNIIATTIEYDDRYGNPDNDARANTIPTEFDWVYFVCPAYESNQSSGPDNLYSVRLLSGPAGECRRCKWHRYRQLFQ